MRSYPSQLVAFASVALFTATATAAEEDLTFTFDVALSSWSQNTAVVYPDKIFKIALAHADQSDEFTSFYPQVARVPHQGNKTFEIPAASPPPPPAAVVHTVCVEGERKAALNKAQEALATWAAAPLRKNVSLTELVTLHELATAPTCAQPSDELVAGYNQLRGAVKELRSARDQAIAAKAAFPHAFTVSGNDAELRAKVCQRRFEFDADDLSRGQLVTTCLEPELLITVPHWSPSVTVTVGVMVPFFAETKVYVANGEAYETRTLDNGAAGVQPAAFVAIGARPPSKGMNWLTFGGEFGIAAPTPSSENTTFGLGVNFTAGSVFSFGAGWAFAPESNVRRQTAGGQTVGADEGVRSGVYVRIGLAAELLGMLRNADTSVTAQAD